jgi:thymidylate synthase
MMCGQFLVRDGELNLSVVFRSHHYGELGNPKSMPAYVANMYGLARLMEDTAEKLCVDIGALTCHSMSAHLYVYEAIT